MVRATFATALITQSHYVDRLCVPIVADLDIEAARLAYQRAGIADDDIAICAHRQAALTALERGKFVIVTDALLLMDLPLDVIVDSTGIPEAGARHASKAIEHGKHVVMVNKETDATIGPILARRAAQAGLVYTQVDGDQHGLLIGLVQWARELGLEVLSGGKARDTEYVYDPRQQTVATRRTKIPVSSDDEYWLQPLVPSEAKRHVQERDRVLADLPQIGGFDMVEMAIAANATGLQPDRLLGDSGALRSSRRLASDARLANRGTASENVRRASSESGAGLLYCPPLYTREIAEVLCPLEDGGILQGRGIIDSVTCLRYPHEAGLCGGVYIVVACDNEYSRHILTTKGAAPNSRMTTALIQRPHHLCGVETPMTILCAGLLGVSTGATDYHQHFDVIARATRDLKAGETLGNDHWPDWQALIAYAQPVENGALLPLHMGNGNRLRVDVPAETVITADMVEPPPDSVLWALRAEQDRAETV